MLHLFTSLILKRSCGKLLVAQWCPTLCDPRDYSPPGSSVHGICQARILEWVAISFSRGSSQPRDWTQVSCVAGRLFTIWAIGKPYQLPVRRVEMVPWTRSGPAAPLPSASITMRGGGDAWDLPCEAQALYPFILQTSTGAKPYAVCWGQRWSVKG